MTSKVYNYDKDVTEYYDQIEKIRRENNIIICDIYPEDSEIPGHLEYNPQDNSVEY